MVDQGIIKAVKSYVHALQIHGVPVLCGVLFGSHAYGQPDNWSDIDVVIVSPAFDQGQPRNDRTLLRRTAREIGQPIEAVGCGEQQ